MQAAQGRVSVAVMTCDRGSEHPCFPSVDLVHVSFDVASILYLYRQ